MFDGFEDVTASRDGVGLRVRVGGRGDPVVLLHGYPQTHRMWRDVAAALAGEREVVVMDLRGYGESSAPAPTPDDANYSKREMAADVVAVMTTLGHPEFDVVGHDRGGRVAHRLALDEPSRVRSVAVLDIVPTLHMFESVDRAMAEEYFHWFFLTRPGGLPERLIGADPAAWVSSRFAGRQGAGQPIPDDVLAAYQEAFARPGVVEATCADYRAAASVDLEHDQADRDAARTVQAPLLALWGGSSYVGRNFDVLAVWRRYAQDVTGQPLDADHYLAEERPTETVDALRAFWGMRA